VVQKTLQPRHLWSSLKDSLLYLHSVFMKRAHFLLIASLSSLFASCAGTGTSGGGAGLPQGPVIAGLASYVVVDTHDRKVVLSSNAKGSIPLGSLSKIATGVVALDSVAALGRSLDEQLTVPPSAMMLGQSPAGLQAGDRLTTRDALYAALMADDNVAAEAVAEHVGAAILQQTGQGGGPAGAFVGQMNALTGRLGMGSTRFVNPHGLALGGAVNLSCASDAARLAIYANSRGAFNFFVNQRGRRISVSGRGVSVPNSNPLLGRDRVDGILMGASGPAGASFAVTAGRQATQAVGADGRTYVSPNRLIAVGLGSADPASHAAGLLQQGWPAFQGWQAAGRQVAPGEEMLRTP
jgi:serine-type D-Ala-D-Ala carboxypeptidase (penicillin-binding protein 5/6)